MLRATGACKGPRVLGKQDPSAAPSPAWQRASPLHRTTSPCCCATSVLLPSEDLSSWFCLLPDSQLCSVIVFSSTDSHPAAAFYILLISPGTPSPLPLPQCQPHHPLPGCKTTDQSPQEGEVPSLPHFHHFSDYFEFLKIQLFHRLVLLPYLVVPTRGG